VGDGDDDSLQKKRMARCIEVGIAFNSSNHYYMNLELQHTNVDRGDVLSVRGHRQSSGLRMGPTQKSSIPSINRSHSRP
jgi:hypothetical protein